MPERMRAAPVASLGDGKLILQLTTRMWFGIYHAHDPSHIRARHAHATAAKINRQQETGFGEEDRSREDAGKSASPECGLGRERPM